METQPGSHRSLWAANRAHHWSKALKLYCASTMLAKPTARAALRSGTDTLHWAICSSFLTPTALTTRQRETFAFIFSLERRPSRQRVSYRVHPPTDGPTRMKSFR
jgi:hypothetical protein